MGVYAALKNLFGKKNDIKAKPFIATHYLCGPTGLFPININEVEKECREFINIPGIIRPTREEYWIGCD